jgi:predicted aminopeptidase
MVPGTAAEERRHPATGRARRRAGSAALIAAMGLAQFAAGCQAGYVVKQGWRHMRLLSRSEPIDAFETIDAVEPGAASNRAEKLAWVPRVLEFSEKAIGLDPGDSYRTYLDTGDAPVSWIVTAAHPLALIPYVWSFPFVGQVPYKGYFDEEDAQAEATRLREEGFEAAVFPVTAFSTLGWFRDPVTSPMLEGSLPDLVDNLIHETTHRTVYFPGNASFNESLATHIAREGTTRFLSAHPELVGLLPDYVARREASKERESLLLRARNDLDALYRSPLPAEEKARRKREIFETASAAARRLSPGRSGISPSNAFILAVARYHEHEHLLEELQAELGGEPSAVIRYLKELPGSADPVEAIQSRIGVEPREARS